MIKALIGKEKYSTEITNGHNTIIADEPISHGGQGLGFSPNDLLAASLCACTSITLRMYADRKEWPVDKIEVNVDIDSSDRANIVMHRSVAVTGSIDEKQMDRMHKIADKCPVHKMLSGDIKIETIMK